MEEVKLFGMWRSPFSCRVEIALRLKGVQYGLIGEGLTYKSALLLQCNPVHKKLPMLLHNGKPIVESLLILEYMDETWTANPLLPQDPYQKAMCWPPLLKAYKSRGGEQEEAKEEVCELFKNLDTELDDKKFFGRDTLGLVDIAAVWIAFWLRVIQEFPGIEFSTKEKLPSLWGWAERLVSCNTIKETLPSKDKLLEYFRSRSA